MAGTKTSNRCDTCRQRKVKCDEAWPTCGSCSKSRRPCPGPPRKVLRWVDARDADTNSSSPGWSSQPILNGIRARPQKNMCMITLRSTELENGNQMHKIRLVDLPVPRSSAPKDRYGSAISRSPPMTFDEALSRRIYTLVKPHQLNMLSHGVILCELFGRFGTSAALDDATLCLLTSHEAVARGDSESAWFDGKGYGKALRSVQKAIDDPKQQYSIETLASVSILWRLEGAFGRSRQLPGRLTQPIHGRAMADMLLRRGIRSANDQLELHLVVDCLLGDVQSMSILPHPCTFDTPDWEASISSLRGSTLLVDVYKRGFHAWIKWPGLLQDVAKLQVMPCEASTPEQLIRRILRLATNLESLSRTIADMLADPNMCRTSPSMTGDPLVPEVYYIKVPYLAIIVAAHAFYTICIYRMLIVVNSMIPDPNFASPLFFPSAPPAKSPKSEALFSPGTVTTMPLSTSLVSRVRLAILGLSQRAWMMYEQTREWKPIGCQFLVNALKTSYPWAETAAMKQWILNAGLDLDIDPIGNQAWEPWKLEVFCKALCGDLSGSKVHQTGDGIESVASSLRKEWGLD